MEVGARFFEKEFMMPGESNITLRIPIEMKDRISIQAAEEDRSRAQIVIRALKRYLDDPKTKESGE